MAKHPEKQRALARRFYANNPEKFREWQRCWQAKNLEQSKALNHRRRARKKAAGGTFTAADVKWLLAKQNNKCAVCSTDITNKRHIDHKVPLVRGGPNTPGNLQLLCPTCNCSKGDKTTREFLLWKVSSTNHLHAATFVRPPIRKLLIYH